MAYILACGHHIAQQDQPHSCDYLRLNERLHLQPTAEQLRHPAEHLLVTVHQNSQIWLKQIFFELPRCMNALDADNIGLAIWIIRRINRSAALLPPMLQWLDTIAPSGDFTFRPCLRPDGGQFRELELIIGVRDAVYRERLETACGTGAATGRWTERLNSLWHSRSLRAALHDLFERRDLTPDRVYVVAPQAKPNAEILLLVEALPDFDAAMMLWRRMHVRSAGRAIGPPLAGRGRAVGVSYLKAGSAVRRFFPELRQLRTRLGEQRADCAHQSPDVPSHADPVSAAMPIAGHQS